MHINLKTIDISTKQIIDIYKTIPKFAQNKGKFDECYRYVHDFTINFQCLQLNNRIYFMKYRICSKSIYIIISGQSSIT